MGPELQPAAASAERHAAESFTHAVTLHRRGEHREADRTCELVLRADPRHSGALHLRGLIALEGGQLVHGIELIRCSLGIDPHQPHAHSNIGNALLQLKRPEEALASFESALQLTPDYVTALYNRGNALRELRRFEAALASYERALQLRPDYVAALSNRGDVLLALHRPEEALASFEQAVRCDPNCVQALKNGGAALLMLDRPAEAMRCYQRLLPLAAADADVHHGLGNAWTALARYQEALRSYQRALELEPGHFGALINRGNLQYRLKGYTQALADYEQSVALDARSALAHNNRGNALLALRRPRAALECFDRALELEPDYAEAHSNRGTALLELRRPRDALAEFEQASSLRAPRAETLVGQAQALESLHRHGEASECTARLLRVAPEYDYALGNLLQFRLNVCEWQEHARTVELIESALRAGRKVINPFSFLAVSADARAQLSCARVAAHAGAAAEQDRAASGPRHSAHARIRLCYLSADLRDHAVSYLLAGVFAHHDRSRFETIAISPQPMDSSPFARQIARSFDRFVDAGEQSDGEIAELMQAMEVDIAVDLMGYTGGGRPFLLAQRAAPVQVNYLGYPGTLGAQFMDYIIADEFVIPPQSREYYSERVVYLPECFQPNDDRRVVGEVPSRAAAGLPEEAVVLCCFNSSYKLNPPMFDIWCRVLREVPASLLWVVGDVEEVGRNLRREAQRRGVAGERVVLAPRLPYAQHLGRLSLADLFLDTLPFNAGTTASDALWAGVPVLTCAGEAFAARMAGSLLRAVGLPELITHSLPEYAGLALELAGSPRRLRDLKAKLQERRLRAPLFDTVRFTRHLEAAYTHMWELAERGEQPRGFAVAPLPVRVGDGV